METEYYVGVCVYTTLLLVGLWTKHLEKVTLLLYMCFGLEVQCQRRGTQKTCERTDGSIDERGCACARVNETRRCQDDVA